MKFLGRLMLWQKLALLVAGMAVPTVLLAIFYLNQTSGIVRTARDELDGAQYVQALGSALAQLANHRSLSHAVLNGDNSRHDDVFAAQADIDKRFSELDGLDRRYGERFKSTAPWQAIKASWSELKSDLNKLTPDENVRRHDVLIDRMLDLTTIVSMSSGLSLDPDAVTSTLIVAATQRVSDALLTLSELNQHAIGTAVKGYLGGDDRMAIQIFGARMQKDLGMLSGELLWTSQDAKAAVLPALESVTREFSTFHGAIDRKILNAEKLEVSASQVFDAGVPASRALQELSAVSYASMKTALERRADRAAFSVT